MHRTPSAFFQHHEQPLSDADAGEQDASGPFHGVPPTASLPRSRFPRDQRHLEANARGTEEIDILTCSVELSPALDSKLFKPAAVCRLHGELYGRS